MAAQIPGREVCEHCNEAECVAQAQMVVAAHVVANISRLRSIARAMTGWKESPCFRSSSALRLFEETQPMAVFICKLDELLSQGCPGSGCRQCSDCDSCGGHPFWIGEPYCICPKVCDCGEDRNEVSLFDADYECLRQFVEGDMWLWKGGGQSRRDEARHRLLHTLLAFAHRSPYVDLTRFESRMTVDVTVSELKLIAVDLFKVELMFEVQRQVKCRQERRSLTEKYTNRSPETSHTPDTLSRLHLTELRAMVEWHPSIVAR